MELTVSKWGNSLGIRIPAGVASALSIKSGDELEYEVSGNAVILTKHKSTRQLFEEFYGKKMEDLSSTDLGEATEMDYGSDVGNEVF